MPKTSNKDEMPKQTKSAGKKGSKAQKSESKQTYKFYDIKRPLHRYMPYLLGVIAVALAVCLIADLNSAQGGILGHLLVLVFGGLFSGGVYALPFIVALHAIFWRHDVRHRMVFLRIFYSLLSLAFLGVILQASTTALDTLTFSGASFWKNGQQIIGGGLIGGTFAFGLYRLVGKVCLWIITVICLLLYCASFIDFPSVVTSIRQRREKKKAKKQVVEARPSRSTRIKLRKAAKKSKDSYFYDESPEDFKDILADLEKERGREKTIESTPEMPPVAEPSAKQEVETIAVPPATKKPRIIDVENEFPSKMTPSKPVHREIAPKTHIAPLAEDDDALRMLEKRAAKREQMAIEIEEQQRAKEAELLRMQEEKLQEKTKEKEPKAEKKPAFAISDYSLPKPARKMQQQDSASLTPYRYPSVDLLIPGKANTLDDESRAEIENNSKILVDTLASFNIQTHVVGTSHGPRITRYELEPHIGVKVISIANRQDDLALRLASAGLRIEAPIPGMSAVGIEVPNKKPSIVRIRDLVSSEEFLTAKSKTTICLGADVTGKPVFADIATMPHLLVAGATGMGKSVCINTILISLLYKARPDEVKLILVDPKKVELNIYNNVPHLLVPVVTEPQAAAGALIWAVGEMERRFDLIEAASVREIDAYNRKLAAQGEPTLPKIVIVIDELNDLMMSARDAVESSICRIAQKARAAGMHLIIGTQRPSVDVITGVIKANIPSRIAFHVSSQVDSRTILDNVGAEKLLNKGDMLVSLVNYTCRVQGSLVEDKEVEAVTDFLKENAKENGSVYDDEIMESINHETEKYKQSNSKRGDRDDDYEPVSDDILDDMKFRQAVELAISAQKISTSLIQRKMSLGFGKAAKYIDAMQDLGIVSEPNGQKPRDVLITYDEYMQMVARRG